MTRILQCTDSLTVQHELTGLLWYMVAIRVEATLSSCSISYTWQISTCPGAISTLIGCTCEKEHSVTGHRQCSTCLCCLGWMLYHSWTEDRWTTGWAM